MMYLFTHGDGDRCSFRVSDAADRGGMVFSSIDERDEDCVSVYFHRDAIARLYGVLGEYLYPVHTPEHANRSLIEQMIERAVKDQVAAVLPFHLSPVALCRAQDCDSARHLGSQHSPYVDAGPDGTPYCRIDGCTFPSTPGAVHFEHDPEPHDVGHPEPVELPNVCYCELKDWPHTTHPGTADTTAKWDAEIRRDAGRSLATPYCRFCGHSWSRHTCSGGCGVRTSAAVCGCEEVRP